MPRPAISISLQNMSDRRTNPGEFRKNGKAKVLRNLKDKEKKMSIKKM